MRLKRSWIGWSPQTKELLWKAAELLRIQFWHRNLSTWSISIKAKEGWCYWKWTCKKAYDQIEWLFLDLVLSLWGFSDDFQKLINICVSTVQYEILINGVKATKFHPGRGLRQGDPLSPFLFIYCSNVLMRLFLKEESKGNIYRIKISHRVPAISHLMYADDLLITGRANVIEVKSINRIL